MPTPKKKESKFVQIAVAGNGDNNADVYALDEVGQVWFYAPSFGSGEPAWMKMTTKRSEE